MNSLCVLSTTVLSLPALLGLKTDPLVALAGSRSDALLALIIGIVLIAVSSLARTLANLRGKGALAPRTASTAH